MEKYPKTLMEMERQFATNEACLAYLFTLRWPDGFKCPGCGGRKAWRMKQGLYLCKRCRRQVSVIAGTIFNRSRLPLNLWFRAMWYVTSQKNGVSALGLKRILGLGSYQTAWILLHKLRRAMVRSGRDQLSGTVEVDETYIGGEKPGKRGRGAGGKALVLIIVQLVKNVIGRVRLAHVPDASADSLEPAVKMATTIGSRVRSDGWIGYAGLNKLGYKHKVVRSSGTIGEDLLPNCHRVASLLKRWLLGTHHGAVSHKQLVYYLDEFTFRFNRRTSASRGKLFYRLVQQAVQIPPHPYNKLVGSQSIGG